jgi:hypothetical protein
VVAVDEQTFDTAMIFRWVQTIVGFVQQFRFGVTR